MGNRANFVIVKEMNERRALMSVVATVWPDYEICWAYDGTEELAGYVGAQLRPYEWDKQPTLKLARARKHLSHLISVTDAEGQLRFWPLWCTSARPGMRRHCWTSCPARVSAESGSARFPKVALTSTCVERRWGRGRPPTPWDSSAPCPSCGRGGRPRSGRTGSRSTSKGVTALSAFPKLTWSRASTAPRRGSASGYSRSSKTARPGTSPSSRGCLRPSRRDSWSAQTPSATAACARPMPSGLASSARATWCDPSMLKPRSRLSQRYHSPGREVSAEFGRRIGHDGDVPLSETTLLKVAGDLVYARGEDYVRYVRGLRTTDFKAYASIQAKNVYQVELDWSGPLPDGSCTCPHHADGNFCKHLVATGLAAIDTGRVAVDDTGGSTAEE